MELPAGAAATHALRPCCSWGWGGRFEWCILSAILGGEGEGEVDCRREKQAKKVFKEEGSRCVAAEGAALFWFSVDCMAAARRGVVGYERPMGRQVS